MAWLAMRTGRDFDAQFLLAAALLSLLGIMAVYSATQVDQPALVGLWLRQLVWVLAGMAALLTMAAVPFRYWEAFAWPLYLLSLGLLVLVLFLPVHMRTHRWIDIGFFQLQPSELAKLATVFLLAKLSAQAHKEGGVFRRFVLPLAVTAAPLLLVLVEPDLGTSLSFAVIFLGIVFWRGTPLRDIFFILSPALSMLAVVSMPTWIGFMVILLAAFLVFRVKPQHAIPLGLFNTAIGSAAPALWDHLKDYQRKRILNFVNPGVDPRGSGWHVLQSKIAIGSGGWLGKGYLGGTQKKLSFLPAQHTDFIFSTIGEELGLWGITLVLALYGWLLYRGVLIARQTRNRFASLTAMGILSLIGFNIFLNIGMTLGMLPVTGIPLPFVSYGGSSVITMLAMCGIVLGIGLRRYEY
ncbi:MAG TPA: rod shape-determining protein RodA [Candidatus Edwardsbacteria bacterium]|nr:rod shape-determining protein RodA [Candidatus Edwardsbacteria bacterium]